MIKLIELLTDKEKERFKSPLFVDLNNILVKDLTVSSLSNISFMLIETEYKGMRPANTTLAAEAIKILTKRAIKANIPIF